jgi:hypothetical protein
VKKAAQEEGAIENVKKAKRPGNIQVAIALKMENRWRNDTQMG